MTIEQVRERLGYWQRMLRLQDWDIEVRIVPQHHICEGAPGSTGRNKFNPVYRTSLILLADPATVLHDHEAAFAQRTYDPELTLVHELVHLLMPHVTESTDAAEYSIEAVASALLRVSRFGQSIVVTLGGKAIDVRCREVDSLCTRIELDPRTLARAVAEQTAIAQSAPRSA